MSGYRHHPEQDGSAVFGVDAFTAQPFGGNPAAVVLLTEAAHPGWMQRVAAELNQPATAFTHRDSSSDWQLRWFTPTTELPLCGHATLAVAHVLHETGLIPAGETIIFATPTGLLPVHADAGLLWVELPAVALTAASAPAEALTALGLQSHDVVWFGATDYEYVFLLPDPDRVVSVRPDIAALLRLPVTRTIVTAAGAPAGAPADITSRVFVPAIGLDEDAVTGSAHAVLGPLWATRLNRSRLRALQASPRGGQLELELRDGHVRVGGRAVTVSRGQLMLSQAPPG